MAVILSKQIAVAEPSSDFLPVGGRIFYDNGPNGAAYTFFDSNYNEITTPKSITNLANAMYYKIKGTPTADRFYVYDTVNNLKSSLTWGFNSDIGTEDRSIGSGKTNTATALSKSYSGSSIWSFVQGVRTNKAGNCDDWYIGSCNEIDQLRLSIAKPSWFTSQIWASSEDSSTVNMAYMTDGSDWVLGSKSLGYYKAFAMRSF